MLFREIDRSAFTDHVDLNLTRIFEVFLNLLADVAGEQRHFLIVDHFGLYHDADLAAGLNGVAAIHTVKRCSHGLELFETFDIVFDVLAARARGVLPRWRRLPAPGRQ